MRISSTTDCICNTIDHGDWTWMMKQPVYYNTLHLKDVFSGCLVKIQFIEYVSVEEWRRYEEIIVC